MGNKIINLEKNPLRIISFCIINIKYYYAKGDWHEYYWRKNHKFKRSKKY